MTSTSLNRLTPTDLAGVNAEAELQTRTDRKYVLPRSALDTILTELPDGTRALEIDGERELHYVSQYFDTPDLASYFGAARGRRHRFKIRARTYLDSGGSFLEVKTRGARSATVKDRVPLRGPVLDEYASECAVELLSDAGIPRAEGIVASLLPTLTTRYRRATLLVPASRNASASRATIDIELAWEASDGRAIELPDTVIVETKSAAHAGTLDRLLWRNGFRPTTISKYGTGMAALHPELPSHKWHRVLARSFSAASPAARAA